MIPDISISSVLLRMILAMVLGGMIGIDRGRKRRAAGFRTYMLVCLGAALTMLISQYTYAMVTGPWANAMIKADAKIDVSRLSAQVINGIGFLGAGTIILTGRQKVKGLTTAAGLWASACMGIAIGAGFYICVIPAFVLIFLSIRFLPSVEQAVVERARNMNLFIEFAPFNALGDILDRIGTQGAQIFDVELDCGTEHSFGAILTLRLDRGTSREEVVTTLSEMDSIFIVEEI